MRRHRGHALAMPLSCPMPETTPLRHHRREWRAAERALVVLALHRDGRRREGCRRAAHPAHRRACCSPMRCGRSSRDSSACTSRALAGSAIVLAASDRSACRRRDLGEGRRRCRGRRAAACRAQAADGSAGEGARARQVRSVMCARRPPSSIARPPRPWARRRQLRAGTAARAGAPPSDLQSWGAAAIVEVVDTLAELGLAALFAFFLLAAGDTFRRKLVQPRRPDARGAPHHRRDPGRDRRAGAALSAGHADHQRADRRRCVGCTASRSAWSARRCGARSPACCT